MSYSYDTRDDGVYLLTNKKSKDKDIVIKMGSKLMEYHLVDSLTRTTYNLAWTLEKADDDTLRILGKIKGQENYIPVDTKKVVNELTNMVIKNLTLESCTTLNQQIDAGFNSVFSNMLHTECTLLTSNNPIDGHVLIKHKGKTIGMATRFFFNTVNELHILEYVGKNINRDMELSATVTVGERKILFSLQALSNAEYDIYNSEEHTLGYFKYRASVRNISDTDVEDIPMVRNLNKPRAFTSADEMNSYIRENNSIDEIDKYRLSLKPKVEIININRFMLREFTV